MRKMGLPIWMLAAFAAEAAAMPAWGQTAASTPSHDASSGLGPEGASSTATPGTCQIVGVASQGRIETLSAVCDGRGVLIGQADEYAATSNPANGSVLVVTRLAGRRRVWLASPVTGGSGVLLEELTRELATSGGRAGDLGLDDLPVDTSRFAADASVGVKSGSGTKRLDLSRSPGRALAMKQAVRSQAEAK